ncbi:MAG: hypothetical protein ABIJ96_04870 [Elusimicrobiota bacterium]
MTIKLFSVLLLAAALSAPRAHAGFEVMGSTTGEAMMMDLEAMANPYSAADAMGMYGSFFDRSRGNSLAVSAVRVEGMTHLQKIGFEAYTPQQQYSPYMPGGYPGYYPPPRNTYGSYNPYNPYYPPYRREPTLGAKFVNFLNDVEASVNNFREGLAKAIGPKYPYVTRYLEPPYGGERIPVYRSRSQTYDMPGYAMPSSYGYYSGYGADYGSGRRAPLGGVPRYEPGYGIVPAFGRNPDAQYHPQYGLVPRSS